ncbi:MAG TPA: Mov34/MPN/PAD-1 family protein [Candidatus Thermoplasmatota archaeon]|nr:Mov34/MPN/PAD-1 family protein [Candidatus Thermoplasmatota archaeon]
MSLFDWFRGAREQPETWPRRPPPRRVTKITKQCLRFICESAKSTHPHEFGAALRAEDDTVVELIVVPTESGPVSAHMQLWSLPLDSSVVGTVHSHPVSGVPQPSDEDKFLFSKFGHTHIIVGRPYGVHDWRAFDHRGDPIPLEVVA